MGLLDNVVVDSRLDSCGVIVDSDSLVFKACYHFKDKWNIELAYFDFAEQIGSIRSAMYTKTKKIDELLIALTSSTNFRYDIYPDYKLNRKTPDDDSKLLRSHVKELKELILKRVKQVVLVDVRYEADDWMYYYSELGYLLSAIDSDVKNSSLMPVYDFNKSEWFEPLDTKQIDRNILIYAMAGKSKDNVKGVKGIGLVNATKFVDSVNNGDKTINDYIDKFLTPDDCLMNVRLVSLKQIGENRQLELHTVEDMFSMFDIPFD